VAALYSVELVVDRRQAIVRRSEPMLRISSFEPTALADFSSPGCKVARELVPRDPRLSGFAVEQVEELLVQRVEERFDVRLTRAKRSLVGLRLHDRRCLFRRRAGEQTMRDGGDQPGCQDRRNAADERLQRLSISAEFVFVHEGPNADLEIAESLALLPWQ